MPHSIPDSWFSDPPRSLVVGDSPYSTALAAILAAPCISLAILNALGQANDPARRALALNDLGRVFLAVPEDMQPGEALHCHRQIWALVEALSSAGEQHDLAFLFLIPAEAPNNYEQSLALGLAVLEINPATTGHAVCRRAAPLSELLSLAASTIPMDLPPLRARRARDIRHVALARLRASVLQDSPSAAKEAARQVLAAFLEQEYHLDQFCRPPSHLHGNLLRAWLNTAVTNGVTPDWWAVSKQLPSDWLV